VVGIPGVTAWYGLTRICLPKEGETIVVSAASGAVGSVVGQLAKACGCRAVGIAGGHDKYSYVAEELGFDACVDYKAHTDATLLYEALEAATPDGVDGCFENVGGPVFDAVLARMNGVVRIALCDMISGYDGEPIPLTQPLLILLSRLTRGSRVVSKEQGRVGEVTRPQDHAAEVGHQVAVGHVGDEHVSGGVGDREGWT
jgi:NADPH-dependent curcumin reductase